MGKKRQRLRKVEKRKKEEKEEKDENTREKNVVVKENVKIQQIYVKAERNFKKNQH